MWPNAKKRQTADCLAPLCTKPPWKNNSSQVNTHTHTLSPQNPPMPSTRGWCHSPPYILFNHGQRSLISSVSSHQYVAAQINSEVHADLPAERSDLPLGASKTYWLYRRRHWPMFSNHHNLRVASLKMSALLPLTPGIDLAGTKGLLMSLLVCA